MEHSISSLAYKGSISEAIAEAKRQKKLLIVYVSGDNPESTHLEESTWMDSKVAETISKYSILLHISEGSDNATNFSAIYPQNSTPCITAIGYNGVQIWQKEGFVSSDILTSSVEKAWLSLHIQEATATFLTAALVSKKSEVHGSSVSNTALSVEGSPSTMEVPSPSTNEHAQHSEFRAATSSSEMESEGCNHPNENMNSKLHNEAPPGSVFANVLESFEAESSSFTIGTSEESVCTLKLNPFDAGVCHRSSGATDECPSLERNVHMVDHYSEITTETSPVIAKKATEVVEDKKAEALEDDKSDLEVIPATYQANADKDTEAIQDKKANSIEEDKSDVPDSCSSKSTEVHLNIRLPDGASLQEKFVLTSTLRMVKDYVDENQASATGSYDLATPYPRKVFSDQDLNRTLAELLLFGRQALIVVPHHRATGYYQGGPSSVNQTNGRSDLDSTNGSNEGYLAYAKKILSYMNPFSYIDGGATSSNSAQVSQSGFWQYESNLSQQNNLGGTGRPYTVNSSDQSTAAGRKKSKSMQAEAAPIGSNIHTLKHDEDNDRFDGRNAFWNGNSTQYGGDNDGK